MRRLSIFLFAIIFVLFLMRCEPEYPPSIYDKEDYGGPYPVITEVEPPRTDTVLAAVDTITIIGENFIPDSTFVYFNGSRAEIMNITDSEIDVISPNIQGDSVRVQVSVLGSYPFCEYYPYRLIYAASWYAGIDQSVDIYGMACDNDENLYVSSSSLNKILKITPDGEQEDYVTNTDGFFVSMKMGPGNNLYAARTVFIVKVPPGGGSYEIVGMTPGKPISDIDFGPNGNLFVAAKQYIYRLKSGNSIEETYKYSDVTLKAIRFFENYVYVGGFYTGFDTAAVQKGIWRHEIVDADGNLGEAELVFDWGGYFGRSGPVINAITFSESGNMYVAASSGNALYIIEPFGDGNYLTSIPKPVYERVLKSPYISLCWGSKNYLYANQKGSKDEDKRLIRIILRENGAPYYGRQQ